MRPLAPPLLSLSLFRSLSYLSLHPLSTHFIISFSLYPLFLVELHYFFFPYPLFLVGYRLPGYEVYQMSSYHHCASAPLALRSSTWLQHLASAPRFSPKPLGPSAPRKRKVPKRRRRRGAGKGKRNNEVGRERVERQASEVLLSLSSSLRSCALSLSLSPARPSTLLSLPLSD